MTHLDSALHYAHAFGWAVCDLPSAPEAQALLERCIVAADTDTWDPDAWKRSGD